MYFEDLEVWKLARGLTNKIYKITSTGAFSKDYGLRDQIRRASVSVMSNISEGHERGGNQEFIQFLSIAKGSSGEVRSQIYVASDQGYIDQNESERLLDDFKKLSIYDKQLHGSPEREPVQRLKVQNARAKEYERNIR